MLTKVKMPRVGENVTTVFIVEIKDLVGRDVLEGEILICVETDKATIEIASPVSGKVVNFLVNIDDEISTGTAYATIET